MACRLAGISLSGALRSARHDVVQLAVTRSRVPLQEPEQRRHAQRAPASRLSWGIIFYLLPCHLSSSTSVVGIIAVAPVNLSARDYVTDIVAHAMGASVGWLVYLGNICQCLGVAWTDDVTIVRCSKSGLPM